MDYFNDKKATITQIATLIEHNEEVSVKTVVHSLISCDFFPSQSNRSYGADNVAERSWSGSYDVVLPYGTNVERGREIELFDSLGKSTGLYVISDVLPLENDIESYTLLRVDNINGT